MVVKVPQTIPLSPETCRQFAAIHRIRRSALGRWWSPDIACRCRAARPGGKVPSKPRCLGKLSATQRLRLGSGTIEERALDHRAQGGDLVALEGDLHLSQDHPKVLVQGRGIGTVRETARAAVRRTRKNAGDGEEVDARAVSVEFDTHGGGEDIHLIIRQGRTWHLHPSRRAELERAVVERFPRRFSVDWRLAKTATSEARRASRSGSYVPSLSARSANVTARPKRPDEDAHSVAGRHPVMAPLCVKTRRGGLF